MSIYNTTGIDNATNLMQIIDAANNLTGEWLMHGFIIGLFIVITVMVAQKNEGIIRALTAASFTTLIVTIALYSIGLANDIDIILNTILLVTLSIFILFGGGTDTE